MRPLFLLMAACLGLAALPAGAQQQERTLLDRIDKRDENLTVSYQDKAFLTGKKAVSKGEARVSQFHFSDRVNTKTYNAKAYNAGQHWQGDFKFATDKASTTSARVIPNASKNYATEDVAVREAAQAEKTYRSRDYGTREYQGRGSVQGALDAENAPKEPLTVDQVRELLNKNK